MKALRVVPQATGRRSPVSPRPISARTPKGERTRSRILEAAGRVFGESGYYAASIVDITRKAKVAQGTFYLYFPGKLDVFVELFNHLGQELRSKMHQATSMAPDRIAKERAGLGAYLDYLANNPQLFRVAREAEFVVPDRWYEWYDDFIVPYVKGLEAAMAKGEIRRLNPRLVAYALVGVGDFVGAQLVLRRRLRQVPEGVLDDLVDFIGGGLKGQHWTVAPDNSHHSPPTVRKSNRSTR